MHIITPGYAQHTISMNKKDIQMMSGCPPLNRYIVRSNKHVFIFRYHLHTLQSKYVLAPADKEANIIIVIC